MLVYSQVSVLV